MVLPLPLPQAHSYYLRSWCLRASGFPLPPRPPLMFFAGCEREFCTLQQRITLFLCFHIRGAVSCLVNACLVNACLVNACLVNACLVNACLVNAAWSTPPPHGRCPVDAVPSTPPHGRRPVDAAPWTPPRRRCPVDAAPSTLPHRRCSMDAAPWTQPRRRNPVDEAIRSGRPPWSTTMEQKKRERPHGYLTQLSYGII